MKTRDEHGRFIKGNPPPKHKDSCNCGRCTKKSINVWGKGVCLNTGKTHFKVGQYSDEKHHNWKGDYVTYWPLHDWIERKLGKPNKCEICGCENSKRFEWANKSGKYKRDINDWIRLCKKCHVNYDDSINKGWNTRRKNASLVF